MITPLFFGVMMLFPLQTSQAQILELDQTIFGMDCTPCAKSVEMRMKRMDGVTRTELDLNKGEARLVFTGDHNTNLETLQQSIIDGGFSPKEAYIKVHGTVEKEREQWKLITHAGDIFLLGGSDAELLAFKAGQQVTLEGIVAERGRQAGWQLTIHRILPEG